MTRRKAWIELIWFGAALLTLGYLTFLTVRLATIVDFPSIRDAIGKVSLSESQAVILGALLAAAVGLLSSSMVKSRELRHHRADQIAEASLAYYTKMDDLLNSLSRRNFGSEIASTREDVAKLEQDILIAKFHPGKLNTERIDALEARRNAIVRRLEETDLAIKEDPVAGLFDDRSKALVRLTMFASTTTALSANRRSRAVRLYSAATREKGADPEFLKFLEDHASNELFEFLIESRDTVSIMRKWWGRRLVRGIRMWVRYGPRTRIPAVWKIATGKEGYTQASDSPNGSEEKGASIVESGQEPTSNP